MVTFLRNRQTGKFAGSIGDGKTKTPNLRPQAPPLKTGKQPKYKTSEGKRIPTPAPYDRYDARNYQPTKITTHGQEWELAPVGYTGARCECGRFMTRDMLNTFDGASITCPYCQREIRNGNFRIYLPQEALPYLNEKTTQQAHWYHATTNKNWLPEAQNATDTPFVHAGTYESAIDRVKALINETENADTIYYLHEITINPKTKIHPNIANDEDTNAPQTIEALTKYGPGTFANYSEDKITRYQNWYEDPSSISIITTPQHLNLAKTTEITKESLGNVSTTRAFQVQAQIVHPSTLQ